MSDEPTPPAAPPEQPPEAEPKEPVSPFNKDGTLVKDWHKLAPDDYEELRESKTLPRIKKFWDLSKSYENVRRQVPLDKMPRPNENFTDADWDEFHKAGGRPDTPGDYNIKMPKDFPEEYWNQDNAEKYQEVFHKLGLSKKQADALVSLNNEMTLATLKGIEQQKEIDFNILKDSLVKKWGRAYDQNVHLGNIAIEKGMKGDLDFKERLLEKINADPDLIEFASNLGSLFSEHGIVEDTTIPTIGDMDDKISKAMQEPAYLNADHPDHKRQVQLVQQLFKEKREARKVKTG